MKKLILACALLFVAQFAWALAPYVQAGKLSEPDLPARLGALESKLQAQGFKVVGRHQPKGIPGQATLVVTDPGILDAIRAIGGSAVVASGIRVAVLKDGSVSYMNPEYWYRAYLRDQYKSAEPAVKAAQGRLVKALGEGQPFGGDVPEGSLANYRYMFGMERFDALNSELGAHATLEDAVKAIQNGLTKATEQPSRVYELVMPEQKIAVFGVAMNDPDNGEGWWVNKIGADHIAGLPYELFVVGNKVYALYARYRIALAWPSLGMGQFMGIVNAPENIRSTLTQVSGVSAAK